MTIEQFDEALKTAARGVNFGPLNGFGGTGSGDVAKNLPAPIKTLILEKWKVPVQCLANWNPGQAIRHFAEACGRPVETDIEALTV